MIVFGSSLSPYVRKVLVFAAEKGITIDNRPTPPGSIDEAFRAASPFGKIPALEDEEFRISDSSAIVAYFDTKGAAEKLIPDEPRSRAQVIWWDEFADTIFFGGPGRTIFFNRLVAPKFEKRPGDESAAETAEREGLPKIANYLERSLSSDFLVGDALTLADIAVTSPWANMAHLGIRLDPVTHPRAARYIEKMFARQSFASIIEKERAFLARFGVEGWW